MDIVEKCKSGLIKGKVSECCKKSVIVGGKGFGSGSTHWHECAKCGKPTDVVDGTEDTNKPKVEVHDTSEPKLRKPTQILERGDKVRILSGSSKDITGYISLSR